MKKMILVVLDGLGNEIAELKMGYMKHLEEGSIARKSNVVASLPTLSRPLYETILTGKQPYEHGIVHNLNRSLSKSKSIFHEVAASGMISAAAAYHWISELYLNGDQNSTLDRFHLSGEPPIHYGIFYYEDQYPDSHVFMDASYLLKTYQPDFMLVHPMNVDDAGHKDGALSEGYGLAARRVDGILSMALPEWIKAGYEIIVTADHGMSEDRGHGGGTPLERYVPFWYIGTKTKDLPTEQVALKAFIMNCLEI
jgi:predicted AlkP superfamily pyrophosphatase or phosphodiesterase